MNKIWTNEYEQVLINNYATKTMKELMELLPNFTKNAIRHKARTLGLKKDKETISRSASEIASKWTKEEKDIIKKYYPTGGYIEVLKYLPYRDGKLIVNMANKMGVKRVTREDIWKCINTQYEKENKSFISISVYRRM